MIIYSAIKSEFRQDVINNKIDNLILDAYKRNTGCSTSKSEIESWKNSMMYMNNILDDEQIPNDTGVAIEYKIPQTSKRIDFILTGKGENNQKTAVIVELKQWSSAELTDKDGIVETFLGKGIREVSHPSYQVWSYAALLENFNEAVHTNNIDLNPCAYLHNMESDKTIRNPRYSYYLEKAPVFIRSDTEKLKSFIKQFIRYGDNKETIVEIDGGRIRPSKNLADTLLSMLQGMKNLL